VTKVLYIEHDDHNLYMLKLRLERVCDFEVLAAEDSEKGCQLTVTERPDVILMTQGPRLAPFERRSSRLVATAQENRLNIDTVFSVRARRKPAGLCILSQIRVYSMHTDDLNILAIGNLD
jgi:hypothetical protein